MLRSMALAGVVGILLLPADAICATAAAPAASAASSPAGAQPRVSPYALAARRQAQAASGAGHAPAVPPSMQRTRRAISRVPPR
jgi:hypothetical protein